MAGSALRPSGRPAGRGGAHVALLRGVNVGGKNILPMRDLAAMFESCGCADVRTYIQSGNVLFTADAALAARVPALIAKAIAARFRLDVPIVTRTAAELAAIVANNPFLVAGADPKTLHVVFLRDQPSAARVSGLDPDRSPPDEFRVRGREIYLCCPNGVGRSKLTAPYFDSQLATTCTARNWNTVLVLAEAAAGR